MTGSAPTTEQRIVERLLDFKLTVVAEELIPRLVSEGHSASFSTILEVLEAEAEARHQRRSTPRRSLFSAPPSGSS